MIRALLCAGVAAVASLTVFAQSAYVPERVFASSRKQFTDFESMLADLARADVVFVGEQHDDANSHRLERSLLEGLARRRGEIVLALEMFERDVQEPLAHFLMGHIEEADFLRDARPWPQYATDYKPLVDLAVAKNWPVVAANVPRSIAADVSQSGLDALKGKSEAERAWFARDLRCPLDDRYFHRFVEAMGGHTGTNGGSTPAADRLTIQHFYEAQCLKDETMAESIAQAYVGGAVGGKRPLVVAVNGAFHSDYGEGVVERTRRRLPDKRVVILSLLPVESLDDLTPDADARRKADYLVYTIGPRTPVK
jgi:uncharacterized iron-regulated protein